MPDRERPGTALGVNAAFPARRWIPPEEVGRAQRPGAGAEGIYEGIYEAWIPIFIPTTGWYEAI